MLILTLRTDKPEAEVGLYDGENQLAYEAWQAHRALAETLLVKIEELLKSQQKSWEDLEGIVAYQGPGSFTGLRIGLTVANTIVQAQGVPIVAGKGESWIANGIKSLIDGQDDNLALPEYGALPHITPQKK
ncbi:MAG: tRNA (adenosine(37)-N6)-threonylcarbamoyltransferase complex dimerization subunit type 1 TsaB [Candidatus Saccharimonadales bacterium]